MPEPHTNLYGHVEVDERFIGDYVAHGIEQLQRLVNAHARFELYLLKTGRA